MELPRHWQVGYQDEVRVNFVSKPRGFWMGPKDGVAIKVYPNPKASSPIDWYEHDAAGIAEARSFVPISPVLVVSKRIEELGGEPCYVLEVGSNHSQIVRYFTRGRHAFEVGAELHGSNPRSESIRLLDSFRFEGTP